MKRSPALALLVVAIAAVAVWVWLRPGGDRVVIDLVEQFPHATETRPNPETFGTTDVTLAGLAHPAIIPAGPSRLKFHLTIPPRATLVVSIGLLEQAWTMQGDGVYFLIGAYQGNKWEELVNITVNPFANPGERRWQDLRLDLSQFAGQDVDLVFNTYSSTPPQPGIPPVDDRNGDMPAWGAPRIVVH